VNRTAARLADRLPAFERELVRTSAMPSGAALPVLRELSRRRPTSAEVWYRLGMALDYESAARGRTNTEAIAALSRARELDRGHFLATRGLAFAVARAGEWSRLQRLERELAAISADDALLARTYLAFGRDDSTAIRAVVTQLRGAHESLIIEAATAVTTLTRRPSHSWGLYLLLTASARPAATRAHAHLRLADLAVAEGRWREAVRQIERAEGATATPYLGKRARMHFLPYSPFSLDIGATLRGEMLEWAARRESPEGVGPSVPGLAYNAAMISAVRGDSAGVREAITVLRSLYGLEDERRAQQLIPSLEAEIAWIAEDAARVVDLLSVVPDPNSNQRYLMARALEQLGRDDEAILWYNSYPDLDANAPGQLGWRAASLIRLGVLHDRRGEPDRARAARQEFLLLWGDADPEMQAAVAEIRQELSTD
jgi:tetratricopeptide (TPR) repeat protein